MTQQYTPVAWQDETTSQQGTLINAERLNQMQTAHHFADGFEEVDAVPTADPSVTYHKIVYCTADNTFYRWDGTAWTADIDDETKRLLQEEIARATEAEGELAQDIADETARATAQEQDLASRITAEASARNQADTALGNRITNETTARESADTELGADIGAETARARQAEQANAQAIATHVADKQNPHEVTKAQIGLGNVDNTADLDKPVSTATQTALNEKASTTAVQAVTARVDTLESAVADRYTKTETDTLLASKADSTALTTKLDILSTTGLHAYTHNGATQSEVAVIDGTTASTIPIRDANGRLQANDPASGATDKSLTTANWVSQSGDTSPNNLLHKNGNETKTGNLILTGVMGIMGMYNNKASENIEGTSTWRRLYYNTVTPANQMLLLVITPQKPAISPGEYGILMIGGTANNPPICKWIVKGEGIVVNNFVTVYSETTGFELWIKNENGNRGICATRLTETNWGSITNNWSVDNATSNPSFDYTTYPYYKVSE